MNETKFRLTDYTKFKYNLLPWNYFLLIFHLNGERTANECDEKRVVYSMNMVFMRLFVP